MTCNKYRGSGRAEVVLNGETLKSLVKFRYFGVDIAATAAMAAKISEVFKVGYGRRHKKMEMLEKILVPTVSHVYEAEKGSTCIGNEIK